MMVSKSVECARKKGENTEPSAVQKHKGLGCGFHVEDVNDAPSKTGQAIRRDPVNMSNFHLPDEYCDPIMFSYEPSDERVSGGSTLSQSREHRHDLSPLSPPSSSPQTRLSTIEHHLPDDYIDVTVSYESPTRDNDTNSSSDGGHFFGSLVSLFVGGDNQEENMKQKVLVSPRSVNMIDYDLPDVYVDVSIAASGDGQGNDADDGVAQKKSLDRLNNRIQSIVADTTITNAMASMRGEVEESTWHERHSIEATCRTSWEEVSSIRPADSSDVPLPTLSRAGCSLRKRSRTNASIQL